MNDDHQAKITVSCNCVDFVKDILQGEDVNWLDEDVRFVADDQSDEDYTEYGARISFPSSRFPRLTDFIRVAGRMMAAAPDYCEMRWDFDSGDGRIKTGAVANYGQLNAYSRIDAAGLAANKAEKVRQAAALLGEVLRG